MVHIHNIEDLTKCFLGGLWELFVLGELATCHTLNNVVFDMSPSLDRVV